FRHGCQPCTRATRGRASDSLRGQWTREGARHLATLARHMTGADGPAVHHCRSKAPWSGPGGGPQLQAESTAPPAVAHGRTLRVAARAEETAGTPHGGAARQSHGRRGQGEGGRVAICARISHNSHANTSLGSHGLPFLLACMAAIEHIDRL